MTQIGSRYLSVPVILKFFILLFFYDTIEKCIQDTVRDPIKGVLFKGHLSRNLKMDPINP